MKRYNINSKIFTGTVGNGKTTNIINELQKLIEEYPDIKIYVFEEYPEISSKFQNGNIRDILSKEIDLVIISTSREYNIPLDLIKPYIYSCPIWLELNTKMNIDIHKSSMKEESIRIEMVLFDFDDTLCIHNEHGYSIDKERLFYERVLLKSTKLWENCSINEQLKSFMCLCKKNNIQMGLISALSICASSALKVNWVKENYGFELENYCVGSPGEKTEMLIALSNIHNIPREHIMIIDDLYSTIDSASNKGFVAVSPMQIVNYVNQEIYKMKIFF